MINTSNSITHTWWIPRIFTIPERNLQQKVVEKAIVYLQSSTEQFEQSNVGITTNLTTLSQFEYNFEINDLINFTPWENLTEEQVLGWCGISNSGIEGIAKTYMDDHEKKLLYDKDLLENPRDYTPPLWERDRENFRKL